jgi:hypothetical protein
MKFNQESFNENDEEAKRLLIAFLKSKGHNISNNCDKYGIDLFSERDGIEYNWEVEMKVKRPWTSKDTFQFDSVSFLDRKKKWDNFWYVVICKETKAAIICHSSVIFHNDYKQKVYINTAQRKGTDYFFRVPKEKCIFVPPEEFNL